MDNQKMIANLATDKYLVTFGIRKRMFNKMLKILERENSRDYAYKGLPSRLTVLDKLVVTFGYYHKHNTMENLALGYGVSESIIRDAVHWVEITLTTSGSFPHLYKPELVEFESGYLGTMNVATMEDIFLPPPKPRLGIFSTEEPFITNATDSETEHPKKNKKKAILRKKAAHDKRPDSDSRHNPKK